MTTKAIITDETGQSIVTAIENLSITDKTLSVENMAADAKATGNLKSDLTNIYDAMINNSGINPEVGLFVRSYLSGSTGEITPGNNRIVTNEIQTAERPIRLTAQDGFRFYACIYNDDETFTSGNVSGWIQSGYSFEFYTGQKYRVEIARNTEISGEIADFEEFVKGIIIIGDEKLHLDVLSNLNGVIQTSGRVFKRLSGSDSYIRYFIQNLPLSAGDYYITCYQDVTLTSANQNKLFYQGTGGTRHFEPTVRLDKGLRAWRVSLESDTYTFGLQITNPSADVCVQDFAIISADTPTFYTKEYTPTCYSGFLPCKKQLTFDVEYNARMGQGIAVYNNVMFAIYNRTDGKGISVYDMTQTETDGSLRLIVRDLTVEIGHGNGIQFGQILDGDFPHLYVSGWDDNKVYEIKYDNGVFTQVAIHNLPTNLHYTTVAVNELEKVFYIFNCDVIPEVLYNYDFIVWNYDTQTIISQRKTEPFMTMQDAEFACGTIIVVGGYGQTTNPSTCYVYDTNGNRIGNVTLNTRLTGTEIEGVSYDPVTGELYLGQAYYAYRVRG